ncbi:haspin protein kinase [Schizosaccharomyces cryophilus OY26]|uniref:non-specific serine/threonine protein kinase n=1 Tax=Schizosaccharomyces cryophilus (strain OY26 / ATCC MYA-4695 / CBS 11777 / NBRC 106824 / NRRL Y48691) TaxID=653667 RepID=S9XAK0_SCHCR|nr:haspin protein kinase [Schizosaccharomyces cryophilus OY26]EPY50786.1 haspin protein kinase [Schizosaccharomyces cryophilus OY26]
MSSGMRTYGTGRRYVSKDNAIWASLDESPQALHILDTNVTNNELNKHASSFSIEIGKKASCVKKSEDESVKLLPKAADKTEERHKKSNSHLVPTIIVPSHGRNIAKTSDSDVNTSITESKMTENLNAGLQNRPQRKSTQLSYLLGLVDQQIPISFRDYIKTFKSSIYKIGEASYSEVFKVEKDEPIVLKIMPFGKENQIRCSDIINELKITKRLSSLEGYVDLQEAVIVKGTYPSILIKEWDRYDRQKESENERPDFFHSSQLFCILCLSHGGTDLEHLELSDWFETWNIFLKAAKALATGERKFEFEHRDMHWGNILIKRRNDEDLSYLLDEVSFDEFEDSNTSFPVSERSFTADSLEITLIDFTLARMRHTGSSSPIFNEFDDPELFSGRGDYQFDIYRLMAKVTKGQWGEYFPKTNILWLHYLLYQLLYKKTIPKPRDLREQQLKERLTKLFKLLEPVRRPHKGSCPLQNCAFPSAASLDEWINQQYDD